MDFSSGSRYLKVLWLILLITAVFALAPVVRHASASPTYSVARTSSGLAALDYLNTGTLSPWIFWGDSVQEGAPYSYWEDSAGMHLGVQGAASGQWAGYYARSPSTYAEVFHARLTLAYSSIPSGLFNTGLYVQTASGLVNYVACYAQVSPAGYYWSVVYSTGNSISAQAFQYVYFQAGGPLTRDCTIVTNGSNALEVYLDGSLVYASTSLNLQMPQPLNAFLEVESTYSGGLLVGTFGDYYAATSDMVAVQGLPQGSTAEVVSASGSMLASGAVGPSGTAYISLAGFVMPISGATVQAYDQSGNLLGSSSALAVSGGDVYSFVSLGSAGGASTAVTVSSLDSSGNAISGYYTLIYQGASLVATGFSPSTFSLSNGASYTIQIDGYGSCSFGHWSDTGSTSNQRTIVPTGGSLNLGAVFNCGGSGGGASTLNVITSNGVSQINGIYTTLWQNGVQVQSCFSPCSFGLNSGQSYQVAVADYGQYLFSNWSDGTTARFHAVSGSGTAISLVALY